MIGEGYFGPKYWPVPWVRHMTLSPMPRSTASEIWRRECEAIHQEMERLILSDWPRTQEENQVRKLQFMALVERRDEAARNFLAEAAVRRRISSAEKLGLNERGAGELIR